MQSNIVLNTDSYKPSHWLQYPPGTQHVSSYIEARSDSSYTYSIMAGMQMFLKAYLSKPFTFENIREACHLYKSHGVPFNEKGWTTLIDRHRGFLPLEIRAVPEGLKIPNRNVLVQVVNTDPDFFWLTSYIETMLLRAIWYPTTVATQSHYIKQILKESLMQTADDLSGLPFKLHDFGARGVSSEESSMIGGIAHLINFQGTDNVSALLGAQKYYNCPMAGFSIPASEHSTMTAWKRDRESEAYLNMLEQFGCEGKLVAVVSDSYDIENAVKNIWGGELREQVIATGGTLVIRPDSGDPVVLIPKLVEMLAQAFGATKNTKNFLVLNKAVRVIQGDGVNAQSIRSILGGLAAKNFSADNIAFGMGGGLLQQVNRDTLGFAMKASAIYNKDEGWYDIYKDPVGDSGKRSKRGVQSLVLRAGEYKTIRETEVLPYDIPVLKTVYLNGKILVNDSLETIRSRTESFVD